LRISPENPSWEDRDRFALSREHGAPAWYAVLAGRGFFSKELLPPGLSPKFLRTKNI